MNNNPFMPGPGGATTTPMPGNSVAMGSDNFEVDLSDVQSGFTIPDGAYRVKCIEIEQTVSKGGNPMFAWTFEISAGDLPLSPLPPCGRWPKPWRPSALVRPDRW